MGSLHMAAQDFRLLVRVSRPDHINKLITNKITTDHHSKRSQ